MKKIILHFTLLIAAILLSAAYLNAQISHGGTPSSLKNTKTTLSKVKYKTVYASNLPQLKTDDAIRDKTKSYPWRFGENIDVNYTLDNSGEWDILPSGEKIWRLGIYSPGALSINLTYNDFYIPEGGKLYIYNADKSEIIGAFTHENNKEHRKFATTLMSGEAIILEYNEAASVSSKASISVSRVTHGYRNAFDYAEKAFGNSGACNNNVACPVSAGWENEIRSVAMMVTGGSGFCTGALVNNTADDGTPYFLTADHCYSDPTTWVFWFNWQSATCTNPGTSPAHDDISSATLRARNVDSDFLLVELSSIPPAGYNVYYAGWNREDIPSTSSVGIHHPSGDIKKISFDYDPCTSSDYNPAPYLADSHWEIAAWNDGTTEGGSSGSPLFDQNHRVIGQLHGGWASCTSITQDYYGKFSMSWDRGGNSTNQLLDWLDPSGTNPLVWNGWDPNVPTVTLDAQLLQITEPVAQYCGIQQIIPTVEIMNKGIATLTAVDVSYNIDGGTPVTQNWTGSLTTNQIATVAFPTITLTAGAHVFNASVSSPNGGIDENPANDNLSQNYDVITNGEVVQLDLTTDNYGSETTWELVDDATAIVLYSGGPYTDGASQNFIETWCLPVGCYTFTINDAFGDGICCAYGNGSYSIDNITTTTNYGTGGTFTNSDVVSFCITASSPPVASFTSNTTSICAGGSVSFTDNSTNTPTSWSWDFSGGAPISTVQNPTITFNTPGTYTVALTATNANGSDTQIQTNLITVNANPTATTSSTDVSCFGGNDGTATATGSGGTPTYTYLWQGGATTSTTTGLIAGTYSVTVSDANTCSVTSSVIVNEPISAVVATISSSTNTSCFGGSDGTATASGSGGTPGYTYLWQGGVTTATATGLVAGTYTVTVTDNNACTSSASVTITEPTVVVATISSSTNTSCFGGNDGTATASGSGGTPGYTYLWQGGVTTATATGLVAGTYTVTVTDNNACTSSASVTITEPTAVVATISSSTDPPCNGDSNGSATVTGSGGIPGYSYLWSQGTTTSTANGLADGTYNVTITDANSCTSTTSVTITQPTIVNAFVSVTNVSCFGLCDGDATGIVSGGTPGYSYLWSNGTVASTATNLCAGNYTLTATDANGCVQTSNGTVNEPSAIVITPSSTDATCGSSNGTASVSVIGGAGNYTYNWSNGGTSASISALVSGTYNVTVTDVNGCTNTSTANVNDVGGATLVVSSTDALCFNTSDGSATVIATGGTPSYTYLWSSGGTAATETGLASGSYTITVTDGSGCNSTDVVTVLAPTQITGFITVNDVTCNGACDGDATMSATGGTPGYTYLWNTSGTAATENNLCAGNISVDVVDINGCTETFTGNITEPVMLAATITSSSDALCNGSTDGNATVGATGGTPTYTYIWSSGGNSPIETGLGAGTYTVTITDNNLCTTTTSVVVGEPSAIAITPSSTDANCGQSDGSASVTVSGGTSPYLYLWNTGETANNITNVASGSYIVTVTDDNGCTELINININNIGSPTLSVSSTDALCNGSADGTATVIATGGTSPYTYNWSSGGTSTTESGLVAGSYLVTVTDNNGCISTSNVAISEPTVLIITMSSTDENPSGSGNGTATATTSGATSPYTYLWSNGGTSATITGLSTGTYLVTVTDANGCTDTSSVFVDFFVSIADINSNGFTFNIYPNPNNGIFTVKYSSEKNENITFRIFNSNAQLIYNDSEQGHNNVITKDFDMSQFSSGIYHLQIITNSNTYFEKIIIK